MRGMKGKPDILKYGMIATLIAVCGCYVASLFMHIGYPLFWNDEGMTVMHGKRVLEYGYPKAWDGKNLVYDLLHPDKELGIDKKTGAFIGGSGWGHYYFAAPFLALAEGIEDDHQRTAFVRFWFALLVLSRLIGKVWEKSRQKVAVWLIFALSTLLSVPLVLHLRDARYYALCVLLAALIASAYGRKRLLPSAAELSNTKGLLRYNLYLTFLMVTLMFTFAPGFIAMGGAIGAAEFLRLVSLSFGREGSGKLKFSRAAFWKSLVLVLRANAFLFLSVILFIPFLVFFNTFEINRLLEENNTRILYYSRYSNNLKAIMDYFIRFEPILLFLALRLTVVAITPTLLRRRDQQVNRQLRLSGFLSLCFLFTILLGARVPNDIFIRYFVPAIPLLFCLVALDAMIIWNWLCPFRKAWHGAFALSALGLWSLRLPHNLPYLQGHVYEMVHPYKGHLDYMIPYIRMKYPDPSKLVIAANYEETSFMYYLGAKVTIGYVQSNIESDIRFQPDVIYFNPQWNWGQDYRILDHFLSQAKYGRAQFPVARYRVNNIPEVNFEAEINHQFRTLLPKPGEPQAELLVKIE
jgi:hypothetical protein